MSAAVLQVCCSQRSAFRCLVSRLAYVLPGPTRQYMHDKEGEVPVSPAVGVAATQPSWTTSCSRGLCCPCWPRPSASTWASTMSRTGGAPFGSQAVGQWFAACLVDWGARQTAGGPRPPAPSEPDIPPRTGQPGQAQLPDWLYATPLQLRRAPMGQRPSSWKIILWLTEPGSMKPGRALDGGSAGWAEGCKPPHVAVHDRSPWSTPAGGHHLLGAALVPVGLPEPSCAPSSCEAPTRQGARRSD